MGVDDVTEVGLRGTDLAFFELAVAEHRLLVDHPDPPTDPDIVQTYFLETNQKYYRQDAGGVPEEVAGIGALPEQHENSLIMMACDVDEIFSVYDDCVVDSFGDASGVNAGSTTMTRDGAGKYYYPNGLASSVLVSVTWQATANNPKTAWLVVDLEPVDAITLGTDVKFQVSMNGGTNLEEFTTFDVFREINGHKWVRMNITNLTARNDKTMLVHVEGYNTKNFRVHSYGLGVKY